jgi:tetratricopeptide (TPR) repeat protein
MDDEKKASTAAPVDSTRIDLGEDLLEKTARLSFNSVEPTDVHFGLEKVPDRLESAKILIREGFADDAKKILHKVLILDPGNAMASQTLNEIHELELKQIFGSGEARRRVFEPKAADFLSDVDSEVLMRKLDQDLDLGLSRPFSLFDDQDQLDSYCTRIENDLSRAQALPQDWIDLGIGFLEMDLYSISTRLFEGACRKLESNSSEPDKKILSSSCLLALSQILAGKPFEAVSCLQPLVRDSGFERGGHLEIFYLLGRAYELMGRLDLGAYYYQQVAKVDPVYRDIDHRLKGV